MSKRGGNHPIPGHFKVQGGLVEDRDKARSSKQAVGRQEARKRRRAGRKTALGEAPKAQRAKEPPKAGTPKMPPSSAVQAAAHDREFAQMNERRPAKRVKAAPAGVDQPRYLVDTARGVARRMFQVAKAPLALARAVMERLRRDDE